MKELTKSKIKKALGYVNIFAWGGVATFVALSILGQRSNTKEDAAKQLVEDNTYFDKIKEINDSKEEEA